MVARSVTGIAASMGSGIWLAAAQKTKGSATLKHATE